VDPAARFWLATLLAVVGVVSAVVALKYDHDRPLDRAHELAATVPGADVNCGHGRCLVRAGAQLRSADDGLRTAVPAVREFTEQAWYYGDYDTIAVRLTDGHTEFALDCRRADLGRAAISVPALREFCRMRFARPS
jgi:hypothetical protein